MTMTSQTALRTTKASPVILAPGAAARRVFSWLRERAQAARGRRALLGLPAHLLEDVGVTRGDLARLGDWWDDPARDALLLITAREHSRARSLGLPRD